MKLSSVLKESYNNWLKKELVFTEVGNEYVSISTPFVDTNYDNINLYARYVGPNNIELSDFGYTIFNLGDAGITINRRSKTIWRIFSQAIVDFGITQDGDALTITAPVERFAIAKTRLLQAIMRINDLAYLSKENITESFNDQIAEFLKTNGVLFTPSIEITNIAGSASHFDFSVPSTSGMERLVKTTSRPNDVNAAKIFNYDVKATLPNRPAKYIYLVDDINHQTSINQTTFDTALKDLNSDIASAFSFSDLQENRSLLQNASQFIRPVNLAGLKIIPSELIFLKYNYDRT